MDGTPVRTCMDIVDEAARLERVGLPVIHLEKGEAGLDTPEEVKEAAIAALRDNQTRYAHSSGLPELRAAVSEHVKRCYGVTVDPRRIIVNAGSSSAMLELFLAVLSPGDEVVVPDPGYSAFPHFVAAAKGVAVQASTAGNGFRYTAEVVREHLSPRTRAVMINFPGNPIGAVADGAELAAFAELGPLVVSDEAYHGLAFDGRQPRTILEFTDDAVVAGSFSKAFSMTGWRLGYLIVPDRLVDAVTRLHQYLFVSSNTFVQHAAITALANADRIQDRIRAELRDRRDALLAELPRLGLAPVHEPEGGFYVFTRLPAGATDCSRFAAELLSATAVAITPGREFGPSGAGHIRFSLSAPAAQIREAARRIAGFLEGQAGDAQERA